LSFAKSLDVGPEGVESGGHFLLASGKVFVKGFAGCRETVVEVEVLNLLG